MSTKPFTTSEGVVAAASGGETVEYLLDRKVDILAPDMIMAPGIDGCETCCRIIKDHPGQKAIIASGFPESERVKEARRLGAGEYIKKPYTISHSPQSL